MGIIWAVIILVLGLLPSSQFSEAQYQYLDKIIHAILFGLLFILLTVGFIKQQVFPFLKQNVKTKVWVFCVLYGLIIELLQGTFFIERSIEFADVVANVVGASIGLISFIAIYGRGSYS